MENIKETPLCKFAWKYKTDKCPRIKHPYTPFYYKLLKTRRNSLRKMFEMGVLLGASLRMWRDFFPNAQVYGADKMPAAMFENERISTYLCNSTIGSELKQLIEKTGSDIDLFIDDGSHHYKDQIFLAKTILSLLNDDVIYIIEDVSHNRTIASELSGYKCEAPFLKNRKFRHGKLLVIRK